MKLFITNIILLLLYCLPDYSLGQQYNFEVFSVKEGLSQSQINSIYEDSRGYLWFATAGGGLCQYDGYSFRQFNEKDGLCGPIVTAIDEDRAGNLWIGATWGGISRFNGKKFTTYIKKQGLASDEVSCLIIDRKEQVWVGSNSGITRISANYEFTRITNENGLISNGVNCILEDSKGNIWIGTNDGITWVKRNKFLSITRDQGLPHSTIMSLAEDRAGNIWIGTKNKGALKLNALSLKTGQFDFEQVGVDANIGNFTVTGILPDSKGNIWFATNGNGVFKYDGERFKKFDYNNGLHSDVILSLCEDRTGDIWFGTGGSGAVKFAGENFTYYSKLPGLGNSNIFAITEDSQGSIWIGTSTEGVFRYNPLPPEAGSKPEIRHFNTTDGLAGMNARAILKDRKGNLWFATDNGLSKYSDLHFYNYTTKNGLSSNRIRSLMEDKKGNIWIGTYGSGLIRFDGTSFTKFTSKDGLSHDFIHSMLEDRKGNLWFGTGNGATKYTGGQFINYSTQDGFCNSYVGSIAEDLHGNLYFGTDRCIVIYDGDKFSNITEDDGLLSNTIYLLTVDDIGNVWAGTNKGIDKLTINDQGEFSGIKSYTKEEGFAGIECNTRAVCKDSKGRLWFGTLEGLIKYNPKEDFPNKIEPKIMITGIKLFLAEADLLQYSQGSGFWYKLPNSLVLPHDKNHLTFEYTGINLKVPNKTRYRFMLEGFDKGWSPVTDKRETTYSNIPPGKYNFKVKAMNNDKVWNEVPAEFPFEIDIPIVKTWWFYLLILAAVTTIVYGFLKWRTKQLNAMTQLLEEKVAKRTEEITWQKNEKEILLKEVHHRVKNNLQVINSLLNIQSKYIKDENVLGIFKKSQDRIKSMSLIHEKLYQSIDLAHIDITEYLNLLVHNLIKSYSADKHISLNLQVSVNKLTIDTLIPIGLIVNELITNSLKYAFEGKTVGKIFIFFDITEDRMYKLTVGDNGKWIKKEYSPEQPSSMGTELISILVDQIEGTIEKKDQKGTVFKIVFKGLGKDRIL